MHGFACHYQPLERFHPAQELKDQSVNYSYQAGHAGTYINIRRRSESVSVVTSCHSPPTYTCKLRPEHYKPGLECPVSDDSMTGVSCVL